MNRYKQVKQTLLESPKTWLITGVAGFIGSNLLETLLLLNQKVIGLDNFATGYLHNLDEVQCSVPRSITDPILTNSSNITGFLNMLHAAKEANVSSFTYAASSSTYGDHPALPKVEENIGNPLSPYAVTKYVNELYASIFAKTYGFKSIGLRYFNVFGKRQDPNGAYAAVIPKWTAAMIAGEYVFINGDGETSRDFCFIENTVQMNILAATAEEGAKDNVYNVAVGDRTTLNDLYKSIQSALKECDINTTKEPIYRDFRAGDVRHSQADVSKAVNNLGYTPEYKILQGISKAMPWYKKFLGIK